MCRSPSPRGVADPGDRPVVVGAPDVDQVVEAAAELLGDVADVGREVGRPAVGPVDHPVLVVAERGRAEPDRAVLLVDVAARAQALDGALDPALVVERALALPDVEVDAEVLEARLDPRSDRRPVAHRPTIVGGVGALGGRRRRQTSSGSVAGEIRDVVAVIAVLGDRLAAPEGDDRRPEVADLRARIVEVVLARHGLAAGLEDPAEQVADERPAGVADRAAGPVGLADTNSTLTDRGRTAGTRPQAAGSARTAASAGLEGRVVEAEVEEARRGDLDGSRSATRSRARRRRRRWPRPGSGRCRAAPGGTVGPASSRGWTRGRRARGGPAARPRRRAGRRSSTARRR